MIGIILQTPIFLKYDLLRRICPFIYSLYICCIPDTMDMKYTRKTNSVFMRFLVKRGSTNKSVNKVTLGSDKCSEGKYSGLMG